MDVIGMVGISCFVSYLRCLVRDLEIAPLHEDDEMQRLFAVQGVLKFSGEYFMVVGLDYTGPDPKIDQISMYHIDTPYSNTLIWLWKRGIGEVETWR